MQQETQHQLYKNFDLYAVNINWTKNLDKAWQCNIGREIFYGSTAEEVFKKAKEWIDSPSKI